MKVQCVFLSAGVRNSKTLHQNSLLQRGQPPNPGLPGKMAINTMCVYIMRVTLQHLTLKHRVYTLVLLFLFTTWLPGTLDVVWCSINFTAVPVIMFVF